MNRAIPSKNFELVFKYYPSRDTRNPGQNSFSGEFNQMFLKINTNSSHF